MTNRYLLDTLGAKKGTHLESLPEITANRIREMIHSGGLPAGSKLPNEIELAEAMGVSRGTIRSALSQLQQQGLIWRRQGVGSFVSEDPILENRLDLNLGVTDLIRSMGLKPGAKTTELKIIPAEEPLTSQLDVPLDSPLVSLQRVRTADEKPVVASEDIFPMSFLQNRSQPMSLEELQLALEKYYSVYYILEHELSIAIDYGIAKLRPVKITVQMLKQIGLDLPPGSVMLYLEQIDYDRNRHPVAVSHEYHVADFCEFKVYRRR